MLYRQDNGSIGVGVHAVRGSAAGGGAGGAQECRRHLLYELRPAAALLC